LPPAAQGDDSQTGPLPIFKRKNTPAKEHFPGSPGCAQYVLHNHIALACRAAMELKTARLTLLIDPDKKSAFETLCARQDLTPSQVVRQLIRDYLAQHGVAYGPGAAQSAARRGAAAQRSGVRGGSKRR
jgi:Ribbon-helix-helix protein